MIYISHNYSKTYERIKMFRINLVIFITLLLLSGCSSVINQPVDNTTSIQTIEQRQQQMQTLNQWELSGKIAFIQENERQSATLFWQRDDEKQTEKLNLSTVFGINILQLNRKQEEFTLDVDNNEYKTRDLDQLIYSLTGLNLPTRAMSSWLKGIAYLPSDKILYHPTSLLPQSLISRYNNQEWQIKYNKYHIINQYQLAQQFTITQGNFRIKIIIHSWTI